jgi:C1q domain
MTLYPPSYQQEQSYPAQLDRMFLMDVTGAVAAIFTTGSFVVAQHAAGANMSVDVAAGRAVVPGTDTASQGSYYCWSDAIVNVPINTAPGTGQSRIDVIVVQVRDDFVIGGGNNDFQVTVIQGTAATTGSQVAPAIPASSVALARIAVGPNVTSILTANITDVRPRLFGNVFAVRVARGNTYTMPSTASQTVYPFPFENILYNPQGFYNTSTFLYTCPMSGVYQVNMQFSAILTAAGQIANAYLMKNGANSQHNKAEGYLSGPRSQPNISDIAFYNAGDTIGMGASTSLASAGTWGANETLMSIAYLGSQ